MSSPVTYGEHARAAMGTPCALCGTQEVRLRTDHCHEHGWVRGSLCPTCNALMALVDRRITPRVDRFSAALTLAALVSYAGNCQDCNAFGIADLGPTMSLRSINAPPPGRMAQFTIRIPDEMRDRIRSAAEGHKRSLNGEIEWLLEAGLTGTPGNGFREAVQAYHRHCDLRGDALTAHLEADHQIRFTASDLSENPHRAVGAHRKSHTPIPDQPHG
jgi:hypothetical protein